MCSNLGANLCSNVCSTRNLANADAGSFWCSLTYHAGVDLLHTGVLLAITQTCQTRQLSEQSMCSLTTHRCSLTTHRCSLTYSTRKLARRASFHSNPTPPAKAHQRKLAAPLALREHILVREHIREREHERKLAAPLGLKAYFQKSVSSGIQGC